MGIGFEETVLPCRSARPTCRPDRQGSRGIPPPSRDLLFISCPSGERSINCPRCLWHRKMSLRKVSDFRAWHAL